MSVAFQAETNAMAEEYENIRVLLVDDDLTSLRELEALLQSCQYHVTTTSSAATATQMLREARESYDLVVSNVSMPKIDGVSLLEIVKREMSIPVVLVSENDDEKLMRRAILRGANEFIIKPVKLQRAQILWQHVVREREFETYERSDYSGDPDDDDDDNSNDDGGHGGGNSVQESETGDINSETKQEIGAGTDGADDWDWAKQAEEPKRRENNDDSNEYSCTRRNKKRLIWTKELHERFLAAIELISPRRPVPRLIMKVMNVPYLTLHNIASHLQKYRLHEKKKLLAKATAFTHAGTSLPFLQNPILLMNTATPSVITNTVPPLLSPQPPHSSLSPLGTGRLEALRFPVPGVPSPLINTQQLLRSKMMPPATASQSPIPFLAESSSGRMINTLDHMTPPQNHNTVQMRSGQNPIYGWNPSSPFVPEANRAASNYGFLPFARYSESNSMMHSTQGHASYDRESLAYINIPSMSSFPSNHLINCGGNRPSASELGEPADAINVVQYDLTVTDMDSGQGIQASGTHSFG